MFVVWCGLIDLSRLIDLYLYSVHMNVYIHIYILSILYIAAICTLFEPLFLLQRLKMQLHICGVGASLVSEDTKWSDESNWMQSETHETPKRSEHPWISTREWYLDYIRVCFFVLTYFPATKLSTVFGIAVLWCCAETSRCELTAVVEAIGMLRNWKAKVSQFHKGRKGKDTW